MVGSKSGSSGPIEVGSWSPLSGPIAPSGTQTAAGAKVAFDEINAVNRYGIPEQLLTDNDKVFDHITRPVREDDAVAFSLMDATTRYSDLDPALKRYRDDIFDDKHSPRRRLTLHLTMMDLTPAGWVVRTIVSPKPARSVGS